MGAAHMGGPRLDRHFAYIQFDIETLPGPTLRHMYTGLGTGARRAGRYSLTTPASHRRLS